MILALNIAALTVTRTRTYLETINAVLPTIGNRDGGEYLQDRAAAAFRHAPTTHCACCGGTTMNKSIPSIAVIVLLSPGVMEWAHVVDQAEQAIVVQFAGEPIPGIVSQPGPYQLPFIQDVRRF
ncbi:MAG: hypothetical protein IPH76_18965 [Xanthomonadales bacterium]|nr:hypothetical protein [Xanthomonadales bacterium]